jgi:inner membrane protein
MPTIFSHSIVGIAAGKIFQQSNKKRFWILSFICPSIPDADVLGWYFGVDYLDLFGHRGITHSIFFALLLGMTIWVIFFRKENMSRKNSLFLIIYFSLITMSHGILDGLTNGGHGVAFFAPFDNSRYFFPFTPIEVSPLNIGAFFGERGLQVILNEFIWILIPITMLIIIKFVIIKLYNVVRKQDTQTKNN